MDNYKIAFINGNNFEDRNLVDGQIDYFGEIGNDTLHIMNLLEYAKNNFSDIPVFNQLTIRHQPEVVAYFLTRIGIIVFFNMTRYDENHLKKYGRNGMFMLPDELTDKQIESLKEFTENISNFSISVNYDLNIDTGILDSKSIQGFNNETPKEIVNIYLERKKENTTEIK